MYEWIPARQNKTAEKMMLLLFGGAFSVFFLTVIVSGIPFRWLFQLLGIGLFVAAIFLFTRYRGKKFIYRVIEDGEGGWDLTVTETAANGKRPVTVCRVGLSGLCELTVLDLSDGGASTASMNAIKKKRKKIYDYSVDFRPTRSVMAVFSEGGQEFTLRLSPVEELTAILKSWVAREAEE